MGPPMTPRQSSSGLAPHRHEQTTVQGATGLRLSIASSPASGYVSPYASASPGSMFGQGMNPQSPAGSVGSGQGGRPQSSPTAGTFGQGAQPQSSPAAGTFGQGIQPQSSPTAGTFGPLLQQPAQSYSFLVSGDVATGQRTLAVNPSLIQKMNDQIARWESNPGYANWQGATGLSHKRCANTRVFKVSNARNPPASEHPNVACKDCVKKRVLCTLVGRNGPVVVPLPVSERSPGATPTNGEYYAKEKRAVGIPEG